MGIRKGDEYIPDNMIVPIVASMIHLYILGTGGLDFGNVLVSKEEAYIIDYGRDILTESTNNITTVSHHSDIKFTLYVISNWSK